MSLNELEPAAAVDQMKAWRAAGDSGKFVRKKSEFRSSLSTDGNTPHLPEVGRYHIYISHACPWAHRVMLVRSLLGLEDSISVSVRSEEHTSELQSRRNLVCRLLLEKKKTLHYTTSNVRLSCHNVPRRRET